MARVLVSAAHTLENPGEIFQDLREADLTRKILKKVVSYLEAHKLTFQAVPLDLQLLQRIEWINNTGYTEEQGDVFVEIHINDGGKRGIEAWFRGAAEPNNKSQKLAETVLNGICKYTGYQSQGAKSEYEHDLGSLIILNQINPIGTAVECLFIDNPDDIVILKDEQKLDGLAKAIADAINDYVKMAESGNFASAPATAPVSSPIPTPLPFSVPSIKPAGAPLSPFANSSTPSFGSQPFTPPSSPFSSAPKPFTPSAPMSGGFNPIPPASPLGGSGAGKPALIMDREERKEMIKKIYKKVLGKEPNQNDLNYYLNTGINEGDLIKKLVESPDHEKMVKDATESKDLKDKFTKQEVELSQLKANSNDFKSMQESLNRLLEHKNMLIAKLQNELVKNNIILSGQHIDSVQGVKGQSKTIATSQKSKNKGLTDFLMNLFKI